MIDFDLRLGERLKSTSVSEIEVINIGLDQLEVKVGTTNINVVTAKEAHKPWDSKLEEKVLDARRSYWKEWGKIPLVDALDEASYVYVCSVSYPDPKNSSQFIQEGLTMRMVLINGKDYSDPDEGLPDDLRFFVGPNDQPLLQIFTNKLYKGNKNLARDKIVAAARVAPIRPTGNEHNQFTPEAFAALNILASIRAASLRVDFFVNTMRPEMSNKVLALPNGVTFNHIPTEISLGIEEGVVRLNRKDGYVLKHIYDYLGYFVDRADFIKLVQDLLTEKKLTYEVLTAISIDSSKIERLKAGEIKSFIELTSVEGPITPHLTGEKFRDLVVSKTKDGPKSYTMSVTQRFEEGLKILRESLKARKVAD